MEDDPATSTALAECLRDEGYEVACAPDGIDALRLLGTMPRPDVIVLDLMLPRLDGWDVRAALKQDPVLTAIPVIALSAVGWMVDCEASLRKPVKVAELLETIERVCAARGTGPAGL